MLCPRCDRTVPADADYCIYCATPLRPAQNTQPAATGPTRRLDPAMAPAKPVPAPAPKPAARQSARPGRARGHRRGDPSGWIFLLGLFLLISANAFWPGILVLIGVTKYAKATARGRAHKAVKHLFFWGGLAFLFWAHAFWPGILLLLVGSSLLDRSRHGGRP